MSASFGLGTRGKEGEGRRGVDGKDGKERGEGSGRRGVEGVKLSEEALERAGSDVGGEADRPRGRGFFKDAKNALVKRRRSTTLPASHDGRGELLMKLAFAIKSLRSVKMAIYEFSGPIVTSRRR